MDAFLKKTGNAWHSSLPRTSSTLSICSIPRTNSSCSLPRKGSLEDILNYSNFLDGESSTMEQKEDNVEQQNSSNTACLPRNFSYSSFFALDGKFSEDESLPQQQQDQQQSPLVEQDEPLLNNNNNTIIEEDEEETANAAAAAVAVENFDQVRTLEEALRESTSEPQKVSYGSYGEFTVIDGIMYNSKGYEICGHLNQHNRPCQRIGKCPFHVKKERIIVRRENEKQQEQNEDLLLNDEDMEEGKTSSKPIMMPIVTPTTRQPMKKTPYKQGWTKEEHFRFLTGLEIHGKGAWKDIAVIVGSRTPTQIQSHAQKYFLRQKQKIKNKRSIHDFTLEDLKKSLNQNVIMAGSKPSSEANSPVPSELEDNVVAKKKDKVKRVNKRKTEEKKKKTTVEQQPQDDGELLQQPMFLATSQQQPQAATFNNTTFNNTTFSPEFARSLASFVSAMQNPALSSAIPMSSYSTVLGSILVNPAFASIAPAFLAQQQLLMQQNSELFTNNVATPAPTLVQDTSDAMMMDHSNKEGIFDDSTDAFDAFPAYGLDTSSYSTSLVHQSPVNNHKRKLHETTFADDIFSPEKKKFHKL